MTPRQPRPTGDVVLPVPELLSAVYLVPTALDGDAARTHAETAIRERVPDPVGTVTRKLLEAGAARLTSVTDIPPLPADFQQRLDVPGELVERVNHANRFLAVSARWKPGWPPVHETAARACAAALADDLGEPVVDTFVPQALGPERALASLPDAEYRLRLREWLLVFQSAGEHGLWTTTKGMGRFGLPELQVLNAPPQYANPLTILVTGIAGCLLDLWLDALRTRGTAGFARIPATFEVSETDVAAAHGTGSVEGGGRVQVLLSLDPASDDGADSFLTIQPPDDYAASAGEYFAYACEEVLGRGEREIRYVRPTDAMDEAVRKARETLPSIRSRFLDGSVPLNARLMVKYKLEWPDGREFPWAYVNSWAEPATVLGSSASDAVRDPKVRAGRPVVIRAETITDWGIWIDGQGIIEGGFTNPVALDARDPGSDPG